MAASFVYPFRDIHSSLVPDVHAQKNRRDTLSGADSILKPMSLTTLAADRKHPEYVGRYYIAGDFSSVLSVVISAPVFIETDASGMDSELPPAAAGILLTASFASSHQASCCFEMR